jgi:hypothetical protein
MPGTPRNGSLQALGYPGDEVASILDEIMDTKQKKSREAKVYSPFRRSGGAVGNSSRLRPLTGAKSSPAVA